MNSTDSHDDSQPESGPVLSGDAITPRGGFMARPGLKPPPRHAVVVRGGDAPLSSEIPVARSSLPPPPSEPVPISLSEKITLRAIPTPKPPSVELEPYAAELAPELLPPPPVAAATSVAVAPSVVAVVESVPPPSDAPVVTSLREPPPSSRKRQTARASRLPIMAAGAAGLFLGLASVAVVALTMRSTPSAAPAVAVAAAPPPAVQPARVVTPVKGTSPVPSSSAHVDAARQASVDVLATPAKSAPPRAVGPKKSIF